LRPSRGSAGREGEETSGSENEPLGCRRTTWGRTRWSATAAWAARYVWEKPPNQKGFGGELVFQPRTGRNAPASPIGIVIMKFTHAIARVLKLVKIWAVRGALLGRALLPLLSLLFLLLGLLLRCVEAAATVGSWLPRVSHRASAAFTMAEAVPWAPAPAVSLIDGGRRIKNIARKDRCRVILLERDVVRAFP
jgi:hypothetical protein